MDSFFCRLRQYFTLCLAMSAWSLLGCTPTLNWRQVQLPTLSYWSPCHPQTLTRGVRLHAGAAVMRLSACDAAGATWAVGEIDLNAALQPQTVLQELRHAAMDNLGAQPSGLTPLGSHGVARLQGRRPGGENVMMWVVWRVQPASVVQASVLADKDNEALNQGRAMFFGNLGAGR